MVADLVLIAALGAVSPVEQLATTPKAPSAQAVPAPIDVPRLTRPAKNLYGKLFRQSDRVTPAPARRQGPVDPTPRVVCGLTMWQTNPRIDPGMFANLPPGQVELKIRRIDGTICRD